MARLGAVTAMSLDGGGSSTLVVRRPRPQPALRRIRARRGRRALALLPRDLRAQGVARADLAERDGVGERADAHREGRSPIRHRPQVAAPERDGRVALPSRLLPGRIRKVVGFPGMSDGVWRWVVAATENESGRVSTMTRSFTSNNTLGHLRLSRESLRVVPGRHGRVFISAVLARQAKVGVVVLTRGGQVRRILYQGDRGRGKHVWAWDGRRAAGVLVPGGVYVVRVRATNAFGTVTLRDTVRVIRGPLEAGGCTGRWLDSAGARDHRGRHRRHRGLRPLRRLHPDVHRRRLPGGERARHGLRGRTRGRRLPGIERDALRDGDRVDRLGLRRDGDGGDDRLHARVGRRVGDRRVRRPARTSSGTAAGSTSRRPSSTRRMPGSCATATPRSSSSRMLPVVRSFISIPAGVGEMPLGRFTVLTFAGTIPWCFGLAGVGLALGSKLGGVPRQLPLCGLRDHRARGRGVAALVYRGYRRRARRRAVERSAEGVGR